LTKRAAVERRRVIGGILLLLLIGGTITLIFLLHTLVEAARPTYTIFGIFYEAPRLRPGTAVHLAGYPVGEVTKIELLPPLGEGPPPYLARLRVPKAIRSQLRRDSRITLRRNRLLGDPVVDLTPGSAVARPLLPGDTLRAPITPKPFELVELGTEIRISLDSLFHEARKLDRRLERRIGWGSEVQLVVGGLRAELALLEVGLGTGTLSRLLDDPEWRLALERTIGHTAELIDRLEERAALLPGRGEGGDQLNEGLTSFIGRAQKLQAQIVELEERLTEGGGVLDRLEIDSAIVDAIEAARVELDSLIEITRRRPWRFFF